MQISGYQNIGAFSKCPQMLQNIKQMQFKNQGVDNLSGDRDKVTISPLGQKNSNRIKNLIGQKQSLLERKNELINSTLENGGDIKSIQDILDSYEEQLKELEQQISQETLKQNRDQMEKPQSALFDKRDDKPKTKQKIEQERISNLVDLSSGMSQTKTIQSSQMKINGEARVLESEIKMDKGRMGDTEITAKKEEKLVQLQQKAAELTSKVVEISGEIVEKINKDNTYIRQEFLEEEKVKENEDTASYALYEERDVDGIGNIRE